MASRHFLQKSIENKKNTLTQAAVILKAEFVGIDTIIDTILKLVAPWYLYPGMQKRPTIINLWGMTGVGKTSVVKRLVELLAFDKHFYHFDMGSSSDHSTSLKMVFKKLMQTDKPAPFILAFDEFQYARTLDPNGSESGSNYSRVIWELFDTGRFQVFRDEMGNSDLKTAIVELRFLLAKGVKVALGYVTDQIEYYRSVTTEKTSWRSMEEDDEEVPAGNGLFIRPMSRSRTSPRIIKGSLINTIMDIAEDLFEHRIVLIDKLLSMDGPETLAFLESVYEHVKSRREINCTQALIFNIGNLDEAYRCTNMLNPDISADSFHKQTSRINIHQIKQALQIRFRNEHIARLGNNHIIYPSLSCNAFRTIIDNELEKIKGKMQSEMGIEVFFHSSIHKLLYDEGVYPVQGTRPLFSTIQYLIEANMVHIPDKIQTNQLECLYVHMSFKRGKFIFLFYDKNQKIAFEHSEKAILTLSEIRVPKNDDLQALTAVHEAGHVVASIFLWGQVPEQVFSISSSSASDGMMVSNIPNRLIYNKDAIIHTAAVYLAGLVAEKLVFGERHMSMGASSDIRKATRMISDMVKSHGLGGEMIYTAIEDTFHSDAVFDPTYSTNEKVKKFLKMAETLAEKIITSYQQLLLELAQCLAVKPMMTREMIEQVVFKCCQVTKEDIAGIGKHHYREKLFGKKDTNVKME